MTPLRSLHARVLELSGTLAGLAYGAIAALMCVDIAVRSLGVGTLAWLTELTEYLLYAATFLAAAWALRHAAHVRVDILLVKLGPRRARALEGATDAVGLAISVVFLGFGAAAVLEAWRSGATQYKTWAAPEWLLLLPLPIAGLMLGVEFVLRLRRAPEAVQDVDPAKRASL
ncbi:MAG TPA: TRAP transporter small permease subunit [Burkholderiales bacterium]|nr:TRAP transporter small permease subunit [Burkholderiales bacterium]